MLITMNQPRPQIPMEFWDRLRNRFNSHAFFDTISHNHISDYKDDKVCDLALVECRDGRWYIEDSLGEGCEGFDDVFNPFKKDSYPSFFPSQDAANLRAAEIINRITGTPIEFLLLDD